MARYEHNGCILSMSYSHKIEFENCNSCRFAYGSLKYRDMIKSSIFHILAQKKIAYRELACIDKACGLGWDIKQVI